MFELKEINKTKILKEENEQNQKLVRFESDVKGNNHQLLSVLESKDKPEFYWPEGEDLIMKKILKYTAIFWTCVTVVFLVFDQIYHNEIMESSIEITVGLQFNHSKGIVEYNKYVVWICGLLWDYWPFVAQYFYDDKRVFVKTFTALLFVLWLKNCLKLIYLDDRPNLLTNRIETIKCKCEFGRPSGSTMKACTIIMFIAWDMFSRNSKVKLWQRILVLQVAKIFVGMKFLASIQVGLHSWNQILDSVLISFTLVYVMCYYEKQICYFFHTIIDHRINYIDSKKNTIICFVVVIVFYAIYVILLLCQWNAKDYEVALKGACPQCVNINWCVETIIQNSQTAMFPIMILFFAIRCHKIVYNPNHLSDTWTFNIREEGWQSKNLKGLLRFCISFVFWAPIIYRDLPHFSSFNGRVASVPIKSAIGCILYFIFRPFLFKWLKLDVKGDIDELSREERIEWKSKSAKSLLLYK